MSGARLLALFKAVRALGSSRTAYALLGLYALVCALIWLVTHGFIQPDGTVDLRLWINGRIVDFPKIEAWWLGGGGAALVAGYGLYGRAVATGPLFQLAQAALPEVAAVIQAVAGDAASTPTAETEHPEPVTVQPVANLGRVAQLGQIVAAVGGDK